MEDNDKTARNNIAFPAVELILAGGYNRGIAA